MRRRDFLAGLAAGVPGMGVLSRISRRPDRLGAIGIQLYTVRRELARDTEGTLAALAEIGFREVEFAGFPAGSAPSLRKMLDRLGLKAPGGHVGFATLRTDWDRTLDEAATLGQGYVVIASVPAEERRTRDDWRRLAETFDRAGEASAKRQIQFCYHNHDLEFTPVDGALPYDLLLAAADPKLVRFEMDLYWITKGGKDPLDYFARWPGRFPLVHVKDMDATPRRFFADLGAGTIDFARIFRRAEQAGIRHYFYEQDETPGSAFESARAGYRYLRGLRF